MQGNNNLEQLFFMARSLDQALTDGIETWAEDTGRRQAWLENDPLAWHILAGTMLVGLFSYVEGSIGRFWWKNLRSESTKRDLPILWKARNAFVHNDNKVVIGKYNTAEEIKYFESYCVSLQNGELKDDKGNAYPVFMTFENSTILFSKEAINQFRSLFEVAFHAARLGRL